jgi:hypothetical protein
MADLRNPKLIYDVDPQFRFAGLGAFVGYLLRRRRGKRKLNDR